MSCVDKNRQKVAEKNHDNRALSSSKWKRKYSKELFIFRPLTKKNQPLFQWVINWLLFSSIKNLDWNYYFFRLWFKYYAHWNLLSHFYSNINMTLISIVHRKKTTTSTTSWIFCIKMKRMNSTYPFYPELVPVILPYTVHKVEVKSIWNWHWVPLVLNFISEEIINPIFYRKKMLLPSMMFSNQQLMVL